MSCVWEEVGGGRRTHPSPPETGIPTAQGAQGAKRSSVWKVVGSEVTKVAMGPRDCPHGKEKLGHRQENTVDAS